MGFSLVKYVFVLATVCINGDAVEHKTLIDAIHVCKRNDPELAKCFYTNFMNVLPTLKDGAAEMNIEPIDPFFVENLELDFTGTQNVKVAMNVQNLTISGWGDGQISKCGVDLTSDGVQLVIGFYIPRAIWKSLYHATGNLLLIGINATGEFYADLTGSKVQIVCNSTRYMKNGEEHLIYTAEIIEMKVEKIFLHFSKLFENNIELNRGVNYMINASINVLFEEMKPILSVIFEKIILKVVNSFHETFSYDLLYPKV